ncbi:hypothetical protein Tco_0796970 [Tanacetum coccineum]
MMVGCVVDLGIHGLGLVIVAIGKKLVVVLVGIVETVSASSTRRGQVFNWEIATYEKIKVDDDLHDLRSVETEFPAIVIDDAFAPQDALAYKSQVSTSINDEIDFRISFDESDDEDYAIIYFFKDFENEFPAILYNDAQMSKSDYLSEQTLSPQHNNESDLNDETSLSEYDEVGQNVLYFNDLFPFNVIHPDNLKSNKDNDNNEIDIIQSLEGNLNTHSTVYTTYSLKEYSVYRYQYGVSWGMDTAYRLPV